MVYVWKINKYPVDAQVAGETIEDIKNKSGKDFIEPEELLEASRDENAPLHCCFEWDNNIAAEKYRIRQARELIQNVTVTIMKENLTPEGKIYRAFVNVADYNDKGKYVPVNVAMEVKDYRKQILENALFELQNFKRKYQDYVELSKVISVIDEVVEDLK